MKAIMISIKPKWVAKILNCEKTIEVRKTMPKCDLPIDVYIYCTKEDSLGRIKELPKDRYFVDCVETPQDFAKMDSGYDGKGKVVAKFTLNKVEEIKFNRLTNGEFNYFIGENTFENVVDLSNKSCLELWEIDNYLQEEIGYAWDISNLVIFDKPKELSKFSNCDKYPYTKYIGKAPQSWCYVEE